MSFEKPNKSIALILFAGSILFGYITYKSYSVSFTHDESYSYLNFCGEGFIDIISYNQWFSNNHILNTLLMKYSELLFGNSELALRLPNLLALLLYMVFAYLFFRGRHWMLSVAIFLLLCSGNQLMDLFGMARGYGLSSAFMVVSFYFFIQYLKQNTTRNLVLFHSSALLACLSNFTLMTYYAAILLVMLAVQLLRSYVDESRKFNFLHMIKVHLLPTLIAFVFLYEPVRRVLTFNNLDFGGKAGFIDDTVSQLVLNSFQGIDYWVWAHELLKLIYIGLVISSLAIAFYWFGKKKLNRIDQHLEFVVSALLLFLISCVIIGLHFILGVDYPIGRFSAFLYPLFMIHLGFYINYLLDLVKPKLVLSVALSLGILSLVNFWNRNDIHFFGEWGYEKQTKNMIQELSDYHEFNYQNEKQIRLGINWIFEPSINYYQKRLQLDWLLPVEQKDLSPSDNYYYCYKKDLDQFSSSNYEIIKDYKDINTVLVRNLKN